MLRLSRFSWTPLSARRIVAAACLGVVCLFAPIASGQDATPEAQQPYRRIPVDTKVDRELKAAVVTEMLPKGFKPGDEAKFDQYYQKAVFPAWTNTDDWSEPRRNPRQALVNNFRQAKRGPAYDRLNNLAMEQMVEFANGHYHPVVRYNAMLLIGELSEAEPAVGQTAKPLPRALPVLLGAYEKADTPDSVRLAALHGILRHYQDGSPNAETRKKIHDLLLALAAMRDVPNGRSKEAHAWFRRLAIESLGRIGSPDEQGVVAKTVVSVLSEDDAPRSVRAEAASALGRLQLTAETVGETDIAVKALGQLAVDACQDEIALCEKKPERLVNARKVMGDLVPIRIALTGSDKKIDRPPYKGILGLATESPNGQTGLAVLREVERLLDRKVLDRDELAPQSDKAKKNEPDPTAMLGAGVGGPEGYGLGPDGLGGMPTVVDPAKAASAEVIEELKKAVVEFRRIVAGG